MILKIHPQATTQLSGPLSISLRIYCVSSQVNCNQIYMIVVYSHLIIYLLDIDMHFVPIVTENRINFVYMNDLSFKNDF